MTAILKVDTIQDPSGNNIINESSDTITIGAAGDTVTVPGTEVKSNKLSPASGTALQIGDSGDTITIPSGATIVNSGTQTGFGGTNTPAFMATQGSTQSSLSSDATTKVAMNTEVFDTDSAFDASTNYRFTVPSGKAGKYLFFGQAKIRSDSSNYLRQAAVYLYKNGNNITNSVFYESDYVLETTLNFSYADNASVGDYYELYAKGTTGSGTYNIGSGLFGATFLIT